MENKFVSFLFVIMSYFYIFSVLVRFFPTLNDLEIKTQVDSIGLNTSLE